jgi:hypothetical protein
MGVAYGWVRAYSAAKSSVCRVRPWRRNWRTTISTRKTVYLHSHSARPCRQYILSWRKASTANSSRGGWAARRYRRCYQALVSDAARYMTGRVVTVDGGFTRQPPLKSAAKYNKKPAGRLSPRNIHNPHAAMGAEYARRDDGACRAQALLTGIWRDGNCAQSVRAFCYSSRNAHLNDFKTNPSDRDV